MNIKVEFTDQVEFGINYLKSKGVIDVAKYDYLKQFVFDNPSEDIWANKHVFLKISEGEIEDTELKLCKRLPNDLKELYNELGYGFLCCGVGNNINRIISPIEIYDFYAGINDYENDIRREYYKEDNKIIFFEVSSDTFIVLDLKQENVFGQCPVYYFDKKVADSVEEFINLMDKHPNYYKKTR